MNSNTIIMIVAVVIVAAVTIGMNIKKRSVFRRLQSLLAGGEFDEFFKLIDAPSTRMMYPEYNLSYFKLNAYLIKDDAKEADKVLENLLSHKLNKRQRYDLVVKGFNIYVGQGNRKRAQELLEEIEGWQDEQMAPVQQECRLTFDIAILGKSDHIEEMEQQLDKTEGMARGRLEYLLALQYENRGNKAKRDEYLKQAAGDAFPLPKKE